MEVKAQIQKEREISYERAWTKIRVIKDTDRVLWTHKEGGTSSTDGFSKLHLSNG